MTVACRLTLQTEVCYLPSLSPLSETVLAKLPAIDYVVSLSKKFRDEIGFIPRPKLEFYLATGRLWLAFENADPCGFICFGSDPVDLKIYQAAIAYDAQRRRHGALLVAQLAAVARSRGCSTVSCWVASEIQANEFWRSLGFICDACKRGGASRGRILNHWVLRL